MARSAPGEAATRSTGDPERGVELAEIGRHLDAGRVPQHVFNDPAIYEVELERIFDRVWLFVGHESEIPDPGDYATRYLGDNPFIFVRDESGEVRVLFNSCRHRGTKLCQSDRGNASHFRCPFHGWTYRNTGDLVGVPQKHEAYPDLDAGEWGLLSAPRVDAYEGLVFASLAEEGPSLYEYLGGMRWYLDLGLKLLDGGLEVVGEPHRYRVDIDWKMRAEGGRGDSYHTAFTHRSVVEAGISDVGSGDDVAENTEFVRKAAAGPHAASLKLLGPEAELYFDHAEELLDPDPALSAEQREVARRSYVNNYGVFPNMSILHMSLRPASAAENRGVLIVRLWQPKAPGEAEMWAWILAPANASERYKREVYRAGMASFTPPGNFEQDDLAVWARAVEPAGGSFPRLADASLNYSMGSAAVSEPSDDGLDTDGWPGTVYHGALTDECLRGFYEHWHEHLRSP